MIMIKIETYQEGLVDDLWEVYYTAIRLGCANHYNTAQLKAWAPDGFDKREFGNKMGDLKPFIALLDGRVVGYADLQPDGYIDHFFVHGEHQRKGVGSALMMRIMEAGKGAPRLYSNVSNTAKPFFENYGFHVEKQQLIEIRGQFLQNNAMERLQF